MENGSIWFSGLKTGFIDIAVNVVNYLPNLAAALILLLIGWVIGRLSRTLATKIAAGLNRLLDSVAATGRLSTIRVSANAASLVGTAVFSLVMFIFITAAANAAELTIFSVWLESIVAYLPNLLGGALIIFVGYLLSIAARDMVTTLLSSLSVRQSDLIGAAAQWVTLLTAIIVGIEQIGIDVTFLIIVIAVIVGAIVGGLALAFGLGAKPLATNLMGAHYMRQQFGIGQKLRIGDTEGQILEFTPTGVVLETADGVSSIPGAFYFHDIVVAQRGGDDHA